MPVENADTLVARFVSRCPRQLRTQPATSRLRLPDPSTRLSALTGSLNCGPRTGRRRSLVLPDLGIADVPAV